MCSRYCNCKEETQKALWEQSTKAAIHCMVFCCCDYTVPVLVGFMHKTHLVRFRKRPCLDLKYRFKQCEIVPRSPKDIQVPLLQMLRMQSQTAATVWKAFWSNTNMSQFINYKWKWYDTCCGNVNTSVVCRAANIIYWRLSWNLISFICCTFG